MTVCANPACSCQMTATPTSADAIYERLAGENNLYGKAFWGWPCTPEEEAKLEALWVQARAEATTGIHA